MADIIMVEVGKVSTGGKQVKPTQKYALDGEEPTVKDALKAAGFDARGAQVYVNNKPANLTDRLKNNDAVLLIPAVKGA